MVRLAARRRRAVPALPPHSVGERSDATAVLATVAEALQTAAVLLDGHDVVLANHAALSLRVVRGASLASPVLARVVRDARRSGERVQREVELPCGAGVLAVRATAALVPGTTRAVLLVEDVSEARRVEAVRRDFVANVSHERKTPVGALLLLAEAIRDNVGTDPPAAEGFASRLVEEATRLSDLVQDLLDLSRLQGGEPVPPASAVPVARLIEQAVQRVIVTADTAGIDIVLPDPDDAEVWGDERSLVTALANLLDNAVKYSARGTRVAIGVRIRAEDSTELVEISVTDQGTGLAPGDVGRVFERFYRADPARSRTTGGTGLGLAIVKHVVENTGGRVTVWSREGVGSTFTIALPVPPRPAPAAPVTRLAAAAEVDAG